MEPKTKINQAKNDYLTPTQYGARFNVSRGTVHNWINKEIIKTVIIAGNRLIEVSKKQSAVTKYQEQRSRTKK